MKAPAHRDGATSEQRLYDRTGIREVQSEIPQPRGYSIIRIEHPEQPTGDPAHREYILGTGALKAPQQEAIPRVGRFAKQPGERVRVAQSQIHALTCERMHDVRRVADERNPPTPHAGSEHAT